MVALALAAGFGAAAVIAGRRERARARRRGSLASAGLVRRARWRCSRPSLATITPGLPNDHYHAFLDPVVLVLVGVGIAKVAAPVARRAGAGATPTTEAGAVSPRPAAAPRRAAAAGAASALAALVVIAVIAWPPAVSDDGGWLLADQAAARVIGDVDSVRGPGDAAILVGIPPFKSDDAMRFPLRARGASPLVPAAPRTPLPAGVVTIVCDPLFDEVVGARAVAPPRTGVGRRPARPRGLRLVDRFDAGPRRVLSVYAPGTSRRRLTAAGGSRRMDARTPAPAGRRSLSPRPGRGGRPGRALGGVRSGPAPGPAAAGRAAVPRSAAVSRARSSGWRSPPG